MTGEQPATETDPLACLLTIMRWTATYGVGWIAVSVIHALVAFGVALAVGANRPTAASVSLAVYLLAIAASWRLLPFPTAGDSDD